MGKSGRHKKGMAGHGGGGRGGGKRRHSGSSRPTPRQHVSAGAFDALASDSDGEDGVLHIGGVRVRVDAAGRGTASLGGGSGALRRQRRRGSSGSLPTAAQPPLGASASSGEDDSSSGEGHMGDAALEDYLENLARSQGADAAATSGGASSGSEADSEGELRHAPGSAPGSAAKRRRRAYEEAAVLRHFAEFDMADEGPVAGLGWTGMSTEDEDDSSGSTSGGSSARGGSDSDSEGSSGSSSSSSSSGSSSGDSSGSDEEDWSGSEDGGLGPAELQQLSLAQRYPVQVRPRPPPLPGQAQEVKGTSGAGKKKKKGRPGVRGAKGGKLAPGEKKLIKRERREAKRAARAAARGFDLAWANRQLEEFVAREGDAQAFGPYGKHECRAVQRLAALYGCRATLQGSKPNRKLVVVSATPRMCLPQGEALLVVGQLLVAQSAAERSGAAFDGRLSAAMAGADLTSILPPAATGAGRWAKVRRGKHGGGDGGTGAQGSSGAKAKKKRSRLKPVAFVSVGAVNPDEAVEVAAPLAAAAAAAVAAAGAGAGAASGSGSDVEMAASPRGAAPGPAQQQQGRGEAAVAAAGVQLLQVVEDLSGSEGPEAMLAPRPPPRRAPTPAAPASSDQDGDASAEGSEPEGQVEAAGGRGGPRASGTLYTRMTELSLGAAHAGSGGLSPRASGGGLAARGSAAAEGITNPGRLLGLGLALGIGPEVFGAPGPAAGGPADAAADLSPLSPLLSKSQLRKLQRRALRGGAPLGAGMVDPLVAAPPSAPAARQQLQQELGRKGRPGRSKAERRARASGQAAGSSGEDEHGGEAGGLGLGLGAGRGAGAGQAGASTQQQQQQQQGRGQLVAGDYGDFERHTTGIGSKLLAKWGHRGEGAGLGRGQQGRAEPLQPVRRAKGLGLGAEGMII